MAQHIFWLTRVDTGTRARDLDRAACILRGWSGGGTGWRTADKTAEMLGQNCFWVRILLPFLCCACGDVDKMKEWLGLDCSQMGRAGLAHYGGGGGG